MDIDIFENERNNKLQSLFSNEDTFEDVADKKIYGYCRISTPSQSIERQIRNIKNAFSDALICKEVYTGTTISGREVWEKLYNTLKKGDVVVFDSVSRMSRNAEEGYELYQDLFEKGIELVFLKEPHINTATYKKALNSKIQMTGTKTDIILEAVNKYLMELAKEQIKVAFEQSEKEVSDLRQRTREGIQTAKMNGKQIGQVAGSKLAIKKKKPIMEIIKAKSKTFNGSNTDSEVLAILSKSTVKIPKGSQWIEVSAKIARNTYYKYKNELFNLSK